MSTAPQPALTAEEFGRRPDPGYPEELVRGRIVSMSPPSRRHGQVCSKVDRILGAFVEQHDLGHVLCNDSGVITDGPRTRFGAPMWSSTVMHACPRGLFPRITDRKFRS